MKRYNSKILENFTKNIFLKLNMSNRDALKVSKLIIQSDLYGVNTHGIFRLPNYVKRITEGGMNMNPNIKVIKERQSTALLDGDNGIGHIIMEKASKLAIKKAKKTGVAWVGVKNSNHAGAGATYAMMPLEKNMVGIYLAVGSANHLPPWGGIDMLLSTNPIAIAIPSQFKPPIVLDMATTNTSYGKVKVAASNNENMPIGWMQDEKGNPITNPKNADQGFLIPIGGPKGYGLALMIGILAGSINGAAFGKNVIDFNKDFKTTTNTGHVLIALDIESFMPFEEFINEIDNVWNIMKSSRTMEGYSNIRLPGENRHFIFEKNTKEGIELNEDTINKLNQIAKSLKVQILN
jgi:LDH2 family malate/lactate/ureidoglycolate dehydrogenase